MILALALCLSAGTTPAAPLSVTEALVVLNKSEATVSFLDPETGETIALLETGDGPHEVAVHAAGKLAVVGNYGGQGKPGNTLTLIDLEAMKVSGQIDLGEFTRPHGLAFLGDSNRLLVTAEEQRALIEVDVETREVLRVMKTEQAISHMVVAAPDGSRAYVANIGSGSVSAFDLDEGELLANIPTGAGCEGIDITPDGSEVWVSNRAANTVSVISARTLKPVAHIDTPAFPIRVKLTSHGKWALVSCASAGRVVMIDVEKRALQHEIPIQLEAAEGSEEHLFENQFGKSPVPIGIQIRPDGKVAYVANTNANKIAVLDLEKRAVVGAWTAGREPDGLGWIQAKP